MIFIQIGMCLAHGLIFEVVISDLDAASIVVAVCTAFVVVVGTSFVI